MRSRLFDHFTPLGPDDCWLWTGPVLHDGYGRSHATTAHRAVYLRLVGPVPDGLELDHLCRVRLCVNPAHLEPVTPQENQRRRGQAQTHCRRAGHPLSGDNLYIDPIKGGRKCKACNRDAVARYNARKRIAS